jgi:surface carbohydrate biosynthesis protein
MSAHGSNLLLPVEIQVREMDAKILLASVAAERGYPVILGSRAFVHFQASAVPRGVYLAKSMRRMSIRMFRILRELGHDIVAWDEEALLRPPDEEYYRWRLSPVTMRDIAHLLAWGDDDARVLRDYSGYSGAPIHVTGNPRIDLMRPDLREYYRPDIDAIRAAFGDFVLINTNFNGVNHFFAELSQFKSAAEAASAATVHPFEAGKGRHKLALFHDFKAMVPRLCAAVSDHTVVLRPHPAENHETWRELMTAHPNLRVVNEGNVAAWLLAARALVANSCTTMVESAILDVPTVNFEPVTSAEYDYELPNSLSRSAVSIEDVCGLVVSMVRGEVGPLAQAERRAILERHIAALDGPLAADRMVDVLDECGYRDRPPVAPPRWTRLRGQVENQLRTLGKRRNMRRPGHRNNIVYHAHRFPDISAAEVRARVARFGHLLQRFERVRVEPFGEYTFRFSR